MQFYEAHHKADSALKYIKLMLAAKDTIFNQQKARQIQLLVFDEKQRQQEIESAKEKYHNQIRTVVLLTALGVFLIIAFILYRNNNQKQKANKVLESTLTDLKSTQSQLIHAEKMASLGELTAGIAHEIQNPLNFVNNFSEVNKELITEMNEEIHRGHYDEVKIIAKDIEENEQKINHHGKRADAIVKGMLQHSRSSTGQKEPTDINALADEYLRLSYHGLRAKDKSFNATLNTDFDAHIGKVDIIPQDIGRALLNLYNNAFYSVHEKTKTAGEDYHPAVSLITKKINDKIGISVVDNGTGIPQKVIDKIFQPFFTTKPTGQGTGLGLSLSYDIVKAHGGEIKVNTKEGEFTEFVVKLPIRE
jgi:signal transduction histidine kinase